MLDSKMMRFSAAMSSAVLTKGVLIFLGYWLGDKLDAYAKTSPLFMLLFLLIAICLGMWYLIVVFNKTKP